MAAKFIWGDARPEVEALAGPKLKEVRSHCEWLMFLAEGMRRCFILAPHLFDGDDIGHIECMRFSSHGIRLQLDYQNGNYVLNTAKGPMRRPPRIDRPKPKTQSMRVIRVAPPPRARPAARKRPPRKTDKSDKRIVELWNTLDLPQAWAMAQAGARKRLSRSKDSLAHVKLSALSAISSFADKISALTVRYCTSVQDQISHLLTRIREPAPTEAAGARLEARWFGQTIGMNLTLCTFVDIAPQQIDWENFPFGKLPEESEWVPG